MVVVHQFEVLKIVCVRFLDAGRAVGHCTEEHLCFEVGDHQHLQVVRLDFFQGLVCAEKALSLNLGHQHMQSFDCPGEVRLRGIDVIIVTNDGSLELVEQLFCVNRREVDAL